jgi:hypothetical protein
MPCRILRSGRFATVLFLLGVLMRQRAPTSASPVLIFNTSREMAEELVIVLMMDLKKRKMSTSTGQEEINHLCSDEWQGLVRIGKEKDYSFSSEFVMLDWTASKPPPEELLTHLTQVRFLRLQPDGGLHSSMVIGEAIVPMPCWDSFLPPKAVFPHVEVLALPATGLDVVTRQQLMDANALRVLITERTTT